MTLLDLFFPKICVGCGQKGSYFCHKCKLKIRKAYQTGQPDLFLDGNFSFFAFEGVIKSAIHKLKYQLVTDLEKELWELIEQELQKNDLSRTKLELFLKKEKPTVVPVPLFWYRQNKRGFNQASFLGEKMAQHYFLPFSDKILIRRKNVISQTNLNREKREENVKDIFTISGRISKIPKNILLVDDVWTTGSTMKEAAKILKKSGAIKIWAITIAR
jgi:ComF family protein